MGLGGRPSEEGPGPAPPAPAPPPWLGLSRSPDMGPAPAAAAAAAASGVDTSAGSIMWSLLPWGAPGDSLRHEERYKGHGRGVAQGHAAASFTSFGRDGPQADRQMGMRVKAGEKGSAGALCDGGVSR